MLTPFGKALRKLRIDRGWLLKDMADGIKVSSAFLSAVETGRKSIPQGFTDKVVSWADLPKTQKEELKRAERESQNEFTIKLPKNASMEDREVAAILSRTFGGGDENESMLEELKQFVAKRSK